MCDHEAPIRRCLELAERGRGLVGTNPLVGSVLVREGKIIAEGWHLAFGMDHAERMLIKNFDQIFQQEDGLYVNLEPCCHYGKTPPCTDLIIKSGIRKVVYGMEDLNPEVAGKGREQLVKAGVRVEGPVLPELCRRVNRGYVSLQEQGRPYITLKRAQTRDGRNANPDGSSLKITSKEQDVWSHTELRAVHDAILVGVQTVIADDPTLTVRYMNKKFDHGLRQPLRLIFDPALRIPLGAKVVSSELAQGTILIASTDAPQEKEGELLARGVRILRIPVRANVFDWHSLWAMLTTPQEGFYGITSILVEGGAKTWQHFKDEGQYDEEVVLVGVL
ncbi:riboflavin biosynthesis protein RibD [Candidatus Peribacteria bacterium RIFOXYC2_FULL_55_14]|nr:MAG: Riboflavin biosynthesis protein RibD [Candidatus Peribacteria bacterium GW2011_GWC2_54_8]KKW42867.1 MAG: Riboflavin biosynthesis protein RibD [Candidatus Peregrinibacteria bacterium GW2011_GWA2_54_9]OGJ72237.1 MAG: riboflavin biosynthesis protein RibD [Candidatus Peribacteria bacterium RIFOXYA1_FULL_56_14]OGJ73606.1 MAG: riboflavin biosynthesis protein RibD [Candidatus Peribacteria bacterium RIFOXYA2_FULL_55_28]OGJ75810.1 MAG: riboflavin biosynthesis protein RibD [Candidatus Peribacteri